MKPRPVALLYPAAALALAAPIYLDMRFSVGVCPNASGDSRRRLSFLPGVHWRLCGQQGSEPMATEFPLSGCRRRQARSGYLTVSAHLQFARRSSQRSLVASHM